MPQLLRPGTGVARTRGVTHGEAIVGDTDIASPFSSIEWCTGVRTAPRRSVDASDNTKDDGGPGSLRVHSLVHSATVTLKITILLSIIATVRKPLERIPSFPEGETVKDTV